MLPNIYKYYNLITKFTTQSGKLRFTVTVTTMHHISKLILSLLLAITILSTTTAATRIAPLKRNHNLATYASLQSRLQQGGSLVDCWNALTELKSCTSEIVLFFLNGESYLTIDCCHAIRTITFQCWPSMLSTVGFTVEEADILRGYCDAEVGSDAPVSGAPPAQSPAQAPPVPA
ncbi:Egg cell-secreted protein 1.1 [Rhynchospora pubera]|uniref:Egg cell-secreted protein 1.1 n=1 Tax=Rhynchospora pubera TaxID=906938 RepID=A0AAV8FQN5_9POAL|nr:Egg cell-secreted protein 1.1 [Rhynchospora pubera]